MTVSYLTDERAWAQALTEAKSLDTLRAVVAGWSPYVPDAQAVVDQMGEIHFQQWRDGLALERKGTYAGDAFAEKYGALLIPENLMRATDVAMHFGVPLGAALIRMREQKLLKVIR